MKGLPCVVKWFRKHDTCADFTNELAALKTAAQVVTLWNKRRRMRIDVNHAERWLFADDNNSRRGCLVLIESFLGKNFQHWNSNSGWADNKSKWGRIMQALSHYSYDVSRGNLLVCDLQGAMARDGYPVISNPVVCSRDERYGLSDLGATGIHNFFAHHKCNEYCSPRWIQPRKIVKCFAPKRSTTFWDDATGRFVSRNF